MSRNYQLKANPIKIFELCRSHLNNYFCVIVVLFDLFHRKCKFVENSYLEFLLLNRKYDFTILLNNALSFFSIFIRTQVVWYIHFTRRRYVRSCVCMFDWAQFNSFGYFLISSWDLIRIWFVTVLTRVHCLLNRKKNGRWDKKQEHSQQTSSVMLIIIWRPEPVAGTLHVKFKDEIQMRLNTNLTLFCAITER